MQLKKNIIIAAAALFLMMSSSSAFAWEKNAVFGDPGTDMVVDLAVARPVGIAATAVGCVFWVASLPFTVWSKERLNKAGKNLVVTPGKYAFVRPLGDFQSVE
ncbi:MAG: hypothetical protein GX751_08685 [Desulfuromonadaceae bacterium]|nr:hypothetical protein [Desulfuromonadaceae bacterium]